MNLWRWFAFSSSEAAVRIAKFNQEPGKAKYVGTVSGQKPDIIQHSIVD